MRLSIRHRTAYRFDVPQARLIQLLRMTPGNHAGQSVLSWNVEVDRNARLKRHRDGFGNRVTMLYVDGPLDSITLAVRGVVLTEDHAGVVGGAAEPLPPLAYLQSTPLTAPTAEMHAFVAALGLPADPLGRAHALLDGVHARLAPVDASPHADQRAGVRLAEGRGDAQGMAHLLIAAARLAGLPARYVAGHIHRPAAEQTHAAHGWAELHVEDYGWIGFDPFEGRCPADDHVRVAIGLDHAQAAPATGMRIGPGAETLGVDVRVGTPAPEEA